MGILITAQSLDRKEAVRRINLLAGKDLRPMADEYRIPVWKNGHENKGWAGLVIEHYLGLPQNSRQAPDFGTWELKVVPLHQVKDDYEAIRAQIRLRGIDSVTGDLGKLVQARTKGRGHGSTTRAFYARTTFVAHILNLQKLVSMPRVLPGDADVEFV
jgi:DNA mismatch repair protein MutH